jgi:peptide/nickel transport system ATP-binding protein
MTAALSFQAVDVTYRVGSKDRRVLRDLNLSIAPGEAYGLVGESGCGKSTAAFAAVRYLARNGRVSRGSILIDGQDLMALSPASLRHLRSHKVAMVYQDPVRALNPSMRIGRQMAEVFEASEGLTGKPALDRAKGMLARVRIADPDRVIAAYPHELSGGMQQRVVIAMALSIDPTLLILDEPTTALDATVEAEIVELIATLRREVSTALLFISHNLNLIARTCERVGVLYAGELVEEGPTEAVTRQPRHPYTVGLLRSAPRPGLRKTGGRLETIPGFPPPAGAEPAGCIFTDRCPIATDRCRAEAPPLADLGGRLSRCHYPDQAAELSHSSPPSFPRRRGSTDVHRDGGKMDSRLRGNDDEGDGSGHIEQPVLQTANLTKTFSVGGKTVHAVNDISLALHNGETLGIVGESGSGKSTLARLIVGLAAPSSGTVSMEGEQLAGHVTRRSARQLNKLQMVFQNPGAALNRSQTIRRIIGRSAVSSEERLRALAHSVRLTDSVMTQKPRQLSGGMQQRVAIARAFSGEARIVVCDEPTSALDVSVQAAILNLLADLQNERGVSYLFISHDLNIVHYLADRIAVLYLGRLVEIGPTEAIFAGPRHPYTEALLSAADPSRPRLKGEPPSAANPPPGCAFQTRCPRKIGRICEEREPALTDAGDGHAIRCHIPASELSESHAVQE